MKDSILVTLAALALLPACADDSSSGIDAGTDADADSDTDTDMDTDTDSDSDTDTDTDSDTDTDTDADTDTWGDAGLSLDELCDAFVEDLCTALIECYGLDYGWDYADMAHCIADRECMGMAALSVDVELGYVAYNPVAAEACHETFAADPCGFHSFLFVPSVYGVLNVCGDVLTSQQDPGDPCVSSVDCSPAGGCYPDDACPGTCLAWVLEGEACDWELGPECDPETDLACQGGFCIAPSGVGESCAGSDFCADELWCSWNDQLCYEPLGEGEVCEQDWSCAEGLWCTDDWPLESGLCVPLAAEGEPCADGDDHCVEPLSCVPSTTEPDDEGTCGPPVGEGEPCNSSNDCQDGLWCDTTLCASMPALGEDCYGWFDECAEGYTCDEDVCYFKAYPGEPCADPDTDCVNAVCQDGICEYRAPLGSSCVEDYDCASRACEGNICVDDYGCIP